MAWPVALGGVSAFELPSPKLILTLPDFGSTLARMAKKTVAKVGAGIPQPAVDSMFGGLTPARPHEVAPHSEAEWKEPIYIPERRPEKAG